MFRIVQEKRGQATIGFRVQKQGFSRAHFEMSGNGEVWRNRGRRCYTVQDAQNLRTWFEAQEAAKAPQVEYEEIGETGDRFATMEPAYAYAR